MPVFLLPVSIDVHILKKNGFICPPLDDDAIYSAPDKEELKRIAPAAVPDKNKKMDAIPESLGD